MLSFVLISHKFFFLFLNIIFFMENSSKKKKKKIQELEYRYIFSNENAFY